MPSPLQLFREATKGIFIGSTRRWFRSKSQVLCVCIRQLLARQETNRRLISVHHKCNAFVMGPVNENQPSDQFRETPLVCARIDAAEGGPYQDVRRLHF